MARQSFCFIDYPDLANLERWTLLLFNAMLATKPVGKVSFLEYQGRIRITAVKVYMFRTMHFLVTFPDILGDEPVAKLPNDLVESGGAAWVSLNDLPDGPRGLELAEVIVYRLGQLIPGLTGGKRHLVPEPTYTQIIKGEIDSWYWEIRTR